MKKSLFIASTFLIGISGFAMAGDHPSFAEADTDGNGNLNRMELTTALPELDLMETEGTTEVTVADVKRALPVVDFADDDVANAEPVGKEQYEQIVDAMDDMSDANNVSNI
ncbi:MAG: hypothetical protein WD071_12795 [Pseudohongiella sp.]|uniref:hypothetical protein n=1 Tax=Pseudohongiella sp. TaxID=1979412 RepID=UPI0034A07D03